VASRGFPETAEICRGKRKPALMPGKGASDLKDDYGVFKRKGFTESIPVNL